MRHSDLREWISSVEAFGELRRLEGADWDLEIGGICEIADRRPNSPALLFDKVKGYPPGYRLLANPLYTQARLGVTAGIEPQPDRMSFLKRWRERFKAIELVPPKEISSGPIQQNIHVGDEVDLYEFPTPKWYELDGGRFIGTACVLITRDPEDGWVNLGINRGQILDKDKIGYPIVPDRDASIHRDKHYATGQKSFPVALVYGVDPVLFLVAQMDFPYGTSEYDIAGGLRGAPIEVIKSDLTGLPIPASAEIVVEGEVIQDDIWMAEGPFGEWPGYYAAGIRQRPVLRVRRIMHRKDPILLGMHHVRPPSGTAFMSAVVRSARVWDQLEGAGVPEVRGVWRHEAGGGNFLITVSIKQLYPGHSKQAGMIAAQCGEGLRNGKYVIVVDEDIDPSNLGDVVWAVTTRSDPKRSIDVIDRCYGSQADPAADKQMRDNILNSRAIIDACRPLEWIKDFPPVAEASPDRRIALEAKWGKLLD